MDATYVAVGADLQVAVVAPGLAPAVLDEEVICRAVVAHTEHTVVEVGTTPVVFSSRRTNQDATRCHTLKAPAKWEV